MTVSLVLPPDAVRLFQRVEGPGGSLGDVALELRPGDSFAGWAYADLRALGGGAHEITPRPPAENPA